MRREELDDDVDDDLDADEMLRWANAIDRRLTPWQRVVVAAPRVLAMVTMALAFGFLAPLLGYLVGLSPPPPRRYWWFTVGAALLTWMAVKRKDAMLDGMGRPRPQETREGDQ